MTDITTFAPDAAPDATPDTTPQAAIDDTDTPTDAAAADDTARAPDVDAPSTTDNTPDDAPLTVPDGITIADQDMAAFRDLSGEMGLTRDQAQRLLTFEAERLRDTQDQLAGQYSQQAQDWAQAARADAEYGGDAFDRNVALAKQAVQTFATPQVQQMLDATGLGSHPEFIRMFWKMGQSVASDGAVTGGHGGGFPATDNRHLFPNSNHN